MEGLIAQAKNPKTATTDFRKSFPRAELLSESMDLWQYTIVTTDIIHRPATPRLILLRGQFSISRIAPRNFGHVGPRAKRAAYLGQICP